MLANKTFCFCGALLLVASALQGCFENEAAETDAGRSFETSAARELNDDSVKELSAAMETLVSDTTSEDAMKKVRTALENMGLVGVFDDITQDAVAEVKDGFLYVNVTMKPMRLAGGLIRLTRAEGDDRGPIFAVKLPLLDGTKFDPTQIKKDFMASKVHIEGFAYVAVFCWGHFRLKANHGPNKFELAIEKMKIANLFVARGELIVDKQDVVKAKGALDSLFDKDFSKMVSEAIADAAKPLEDALKKKQNELKAECDDCEKKNALEKPICTIEKCWFADLVKLGKEVIGGAADAVKFILDKAAEIFTLHEASFETIVDASSDASTKLLLMLKATVFGKNIDNSVEVNLSQLKDAAQDVAKLFAPEIFTEKFKLER